MAPHAEHSPSFTSSSEPVKIDIPVLIAGGGPTGLLQAHMLYKLEVKSLIIERYPKRLDAPKAHALSPRTLEICRQFGIDVNEIRRLGSQRKDAYWVNFVTSLTDIHVGKLPYERMDVEALEDTPTMIHNIPQPTFEELVARYLKEEGIEVRKNHSFLSCKVVGNTVITTIEDRAAKTEYQIRSNYVIACDGAKSRVRECLGIPTEGSVSDEVMMTIHFSANLLPLLGDNVGMLHWIMDPEVSGFIIGYDLGDNQVLICNFDPKKHPAPWSPAFCQQTISAALGPLASSTPFTVHSARPWVFSRKVASSYSSPSQRIFLAGDAAHSFPPTGGLGLNTGLSDVHNLAYKISHSYHLSQTQTLASGSLRINGDLLRGYEKDRKQVALVNSNQSVKNGLKIFAFLKTMGATDPDPRIAKCNLLSRVQSSLPADIEAIADGIEGQREHFDNHGLHIGYVYGDEIVPAHASIYERRFVKGARVPHVWLTTKPDVEWLKRMEAVDCGYVDEFGEEERRAREWSCLDLCAFDAFTVFSGDEGWEAAVQRAREVLPEVVKVNCVVLSRDFEFVEDEKRDEWVGGMGLLDGGAVVVRPDQHILALLKRGEEGGLVVALKQHLGL